MNGRKNLMDFWLCVQVRLLQPLQLLLLLHVLLSLLVDLPPLLQLPIDAINASMEIQVDMVSVSQNKKLKS
jgi:hypothetical protein